MKKKSKHKFASMKKPRVPRKRPATDEPTNKSKVANTMTNWQKVIAFQKMHGGRPPRRSWRSRVDPEENKLAKKLALLLSSKEKDDSSMKFLAVYRELQEKGLGTKTKKFDSSDRAHSPAKKRKLVAADSIGAEPSTPRIGDSPRNLLPLTPASAAKLAQSCRKSPLPEMGSPELVDLTKASLPLNPTRDATFMEDDLLEKASPEVRMLYSHIQGECKSRGDPQYIPHWGREGSWYKKVWSIRKHVVEASGDLTPADYRVLCLMSHIFQHGKPSQNVFGCEVPVDGGWRWTFGAYINISSDTFKTKEEATRELTCIQHELHHAWHEKDKREAHLKSILQHLAQHKALQTVSEERSLKFARMSLQQESREYHKAQDLARGFQNLGNTCYLNSIVQCLLHCTPFRHDLESQPSGSSYLGDRLKELWALYKQQTATTTVVLTALASLVEQFLNFTGFAGGRQQDAAECLMYFLQAVDGGRMQGRVCKSYAAANIESMILCRASEEAQVSREAAPVSMASMLIASLTGEQALQEAPPALIVRVENIYEQNDEYFFIDALVSWDATRLELTVMGDDNNTVVYKVSGYVAHIYHGDVDARQRMSSGHYVAYMNMDDTWYRVTL
jgi:hypothetical protein